MKTEVEKERSRDNVACSFTHHMQFVAAAMLFVGFWLIMTCRIEGTISENSNTKFVLAPLFVVRAWAGLRLTKIELFLFETYIKIVTLRKKTRGNGNVD